MSEEKGFSVIEVMISISLFAVALGAIATSSYKNMNFNTIMEQKSVATTVAQQMLEDFRQGDPVALPTSGTTSVNIVRGNRTFVATTTYCATPAYCTTSSRHLSVTVSYKNKSLVTLSTVFTALR